MNWFVSQELLRKLQTGMSAWPFTDPRPGGLKRIGFNSCPNHTILEPSERTHLLEYW